MELLPVVAVAVVAALVTLALCDLAGRIAAAKGRSYWLFFAFGLVLWFPSLITALALPAQSSGAPAAAEPRRSELAPAVLVLVLAVLAAALGLWSAIAYAP